MGAKGARRIYVDNRMTVTLVSGFGDDKWHWVTLPPRPADWRATYDARREEDVVRVARTRCGLTPERVYQGGGTSVPTRWRHTAPSCVLGTYTALCHRCFRFAGEAKL